MMAGEIIIGGARAYLAEQRRSDEERWTQLYQLLRKAERALQTREPLTALALLLEAEDVEWTLLLECEATGRAVCELCNLLGLDEHDVAEAWDAAGRRKTP